MSLLSAAATRQVILRNKCVRVAKRVKSRKGYNVQCRSPAENSWQAVQDIQFGRQVISRGAADAERPKLHLQPNVFTAYPGVHRRDLRKQELRIIAKIKEKSESLFAKCCTFCSKTSSRKYGEKQAKSIAFRGFSTVFTLPVEGVHLPLRQAVRKLWSFAKYCESLSFSQGFCKVFAKLFS